MAEKRKFNFSGANLSTRDPDAASHNAGGESRVQELVSSIENVNINTAFNFKYIPRRRLVFSKKNDYPMQAIEKLAKSILDVGLMHNIDVSYDEETDTYTIDAGEQRTRAIDLLIERYMNYEDKDSVEYQRYLYHVQPFEKGYPCKVSSGTSRMKMSENFGSDIKKEIDEIEAEMRLRISNEIGREHDPVRTQESVNLLIKLEQRRSVLLGAKERVNINKKVGEQLNISERQVMKYKAMDRLIPELQEVFKNKGITIAEGASYANLSNDEQKQILSLIEAGGSKAELNTLYEKLNQLREDMKSKVKQLQNLENEKAVALKLVEQAKRDATVLEQKIRDEVENETALRGETNLITIKRLQKELELAHQDVQKQEKRVEAAEDEKIQLEKRLKEKEMEKPKVPSALMRAALHMENMLHMVEDSKKRFDEALGDYQKIYDGTSEHLSPEEFRSEFERIIGL